MTDFNFQRLLQLFVVPVGPPPIFCSLEVVDEFKDRNYRRRVAGKRLISFIDAGSDLRTGANQAMADDQALKGDAKLVLVR